MKDITTQQTNSFDLITTMWKFTLALFILSNTIFTFTDYTLINSIALYIFIGVSLIAIIAKGEVKFTFYIFSIIAFFLMMIIGIFYSDNNHALNVTYSFFVVLCLVFSMYNYIEYNSDIKFIFKCFLYGGILMDFYILLYYGSDFVSLLSSGDRVGDIAGNLNDVGMKSAYSALMALYLILNDKLKLKGKILYYLLTFIGVFFSLITGSKKVVLLLFLGCAIIFIFRKNKTISTAQTIKNFILAFVAIFAVYLIIYNIPVFSVIRNRIDKFVMFITGESNATSGSSYLRSKYIREGFSVFMQKPIIGDGTASSYTYFGTYSHCNFVEILMNHGLVGFLVFYIPYPFILYKGIASFFKNKHTNDLLVLSLFVFISVLVLSMAMIYYTSLYFQSLLVISSTYILNNINKSTDS